MGGARALERPQVCVGQVGAPTEHTSLPGNHLEWVQWRWGSSGLGAGQQLRPAACTLAPQPWGGPWIQNAQRFCGLSASRWGWGKHGWATSLLGKQKACKGQPGCVCFSPGQETSVGLHHSLTAGVRLLVKVDLVFWKKKKNQENTLQVWLPCATFRVCSPRRAEARQGAGAVSGELGPGAPLKGRKRCVCSRSRLVVAGHFASADFRLPSELERQPRRAADTQQLP
ncbi:uncharacterized protein LOC128587318 isoform X1 [Nycticebus coucang]|uniref:uncharacterized protein LOC128587318 isoform X1 n=1 Tax=Nycticebus coucang TaxID=9470 RepID=UPI00234C2072|nr:uncharacterized protein LOC128587318 isoform X1 [Nycticebus coucang]